MWRKCAVSLDAVEEGSAGALTAAERANDRHRDRADAAPQTAGERHVTPNVYLARSDVALQVLEAENYFDPGTSVITLVVAI